MSIHEPMTLATDYLLAIVVVSMGFALLRSAHGQRSIRLWAASFFASGAAAFFGGTWHGFHDRMTPNVDSTLWKATMVSIGLGSACLAIGAMAATLAFSTRRILQLAVLLGLVVYVVWVTTQSDDFRSAIIIYGACMILVAVTMVARFSTERSMASWVLGGIAISFFAAGVQQSELTIHRHFNHNDLYHVIQIIGFVCLFRGGRLMRDRPD